MAGKTKSTNGTHTEEDEAIRRRFASGEKNDSVKGKASVKEAI